MFQNQWNYLVAVVWFLCLVTVVVGAVVASVWKSGLRTGKKP